MSTSPSRRNDRFWGTGSSSGEPKLTKHQQDEALARVAQGETLTAIARSFNVSHMTINVSHMTISRLAGVAFMQ